MKFVIDIPEREFKADIDDHFQYFFMRLQEEIQHRLCTHDTFLCEKDELETVEMLLESFKNATLEQESKTGHWDKGYTFPDGEYWKCTKCNELIKVKYPMKYCNNCGAKMESEG